MNARPRRVARCVSRAQIGLHAPLVEIEVNLGSGLPSFSIVGLPATVVKESKERVRAALVNASFEFPAGRITVNLAPADLPKDGGRFDLPIALGILVASGQLEAPDLEAVELYGELGLGGELKPVPGLLLAAAHAARDRHAMIVPAADLPEVSLPGGTEIYGARHLLEVHDHLAHRRRLGRCGSRPACAPERERTDLAEVRGQSQAKRAVLIAAAGAHSLLMVGPPGCGKTMLAQRLPALLPPLDPDEALEVASIAAVSGVGFDPGRWAQRPFRAPHHTASAQAIIGGGPRARPGEVSLAHHGVLFLDEFAEFDRRVLEALREPLESGSVSVSRASTQVVYPAGFQLVAAMNPCPCGWRGAAAGRCRCPAARTARYRERISGPLLDRIDLRIEMTAVSPEELGGAASEGTAEIRERVGAARAFQRCHSRGPGARLPVAALGRDCALEPAARGLLERALRRFPTSARSHHRLLRVARTIADLDARPVITEEHLAEAMSLRRALEGEDAGA